jgi:NAD(P)-dependent dehydrogenase (short-subunit alcohol dehydrogenase family)
VTSAAERCAIVTGTSSGIGAKISAQLLEHDWTVIGISRRVVPVRDPRYEHVALDLADATELSRTAEARIAPLRWDSWRATVRPRARCAS